MKVVALLLLVALAPGCSSTKAPSEANASANSAAAAPAVAVQTAKVEVRELQRSVEAVGSLDPNEEITVTNQVEGLVSNVFVDLGDFVKSGQVIAQLDTNELELAVRQQTAALEQELAHLGLTDSSADIDDAATSQVRQADATLSEAKLQLERTKSLVAEGLLPRQQLESAQARYDVAEAFLRTARENVRNIRATITARKVALALAQKKLADAKISAPMSGFIKERLVSAGLFLKVNSPVVTLVQNSPLKLHFDVPENALDSVRAGGSVQFQVDSFPDRKFAGKISRVSPSIDRQSRTMKVEALVDNSAALLKPGLFARVVILTNHRDKALVVPSTAVFQFAGLEKLFVIENGKVAERIIRSGTQTDESIEIVEGVKEGDVVAISNLGSLQQGREVTTR
jgi:multidrug efflux pump subunit AcrA (membrane-fusion protein)